MNRQRCTKRCFPSARLAKRLHGHARFRVRVYWCDECKAFHVTNQEKKR